MNMLKPVAFKDIKGWAEDDLNCALETFQRSAIEILQNGHGFKRQARFGGTRENWRKSCEKSLTAKRGRNFFETHFRAFQVNVDGGSGGLFTGYYEPMVLGSRTPSQDYRVPIYAPPGDLVTFSDVERETTGLNYGRRENGKAVGYYTRQQIESGALEGRGLELCFIKSWVDAFFIHVQGSGRVLLDDGQVIRLSYAAKNGQDYTGIGGILSARGIGTPQTMSMQLLRDWMAQNPSQTHELLWNNNSFIFFQVTEISDPHLGAIGAAKVNLTPLRSLAVDRSNWMFGTPLFIDTLEPREAQNGPSPFRHLMIAQDTGTAIKGLVRGDIYWGWGETAAQNSGHMKSPGEMFALLPHRLVEGLTR